MKDGARSVAAEHFAIFSRISGVWEPGWRRDRVSRTILRGGLLDERPLGRSAIGLITEKVRNHDVSFEFGVLMGLSSALGLTGRRFARILSAWLRGETTRAKIRKWGDGIGLRIPRSLVGTAGFVAGAEVELVILRGEMIVTPVERIRYRLDELLRQVNPKNVHREANADAQVGREVW